MRRILAVSVAAACLTLAPALVGLAKPIDDAFYKAYYLEREKGDFAAAAKLYEEIASASGAAAEVKAEAQARLAALREEMATADFAQLMPPDTMVYLEISRPGEQLTRLLEMVGLLAGSGQPGGADPANELSKALGGRHIAVSPALIKGVLGIRGAAVAVTGIDMANQMPSGVAIFHPGDLDVVRGLIESGLPAAAEAVKPIEGYPAYQIKEANNLVVCLTSRLVIISPQRPQIVAAIKRMNGEGESLASNPVLAEVMKQRGDSLVFYCANAKAIMPMVTPLVGASKDLAMAQAVLDLNSLNWVSGRIGVGETGLFHDFGIGLDKGHHNLAYNMIRTPPVTKETLNCVPKGAAGFIVAALGESSGAARPKAKDGEPRSVVGLDLGREIFANILDFAVFAVPPSSDGRSEGDSFPGPDVAAVIRVNDPGKSEALWTQILGIASLAAGAPTTDGTTESISGVDVRAYKFPEGITIYFANVDDKVVVSATRYAISRAVEAARGGESIITDEAFSASLAGISEHTSKAVFAHPGRCFQIAKKFMPEGEAKEAEPYVGMFTHTVASFQTHESEEVFRISASITGLPKLGGLVAQLLQEQHRGDEMRTALHEAESTKDWDAALRKLDEIVAADGENSARMRKRFELLATGKKDREAALACADIIVEKLGKNTGALNEFAWGLLTESKFEGQYNDLALKIAAQACELSEYKNWMIVDTLARAKFEAGDVEAAIELQQKAVELEGGNRQDVKDALARYQAARKSGPTARSD